MSNPDPTKPLPNDEKFKPRNVADLQKDQAPTNKRGAPADTEGYDVEHGSDGMTKPTPSA